jgi:hypothetical protein
MPGDFRAAFGYQFQVRGWDDVLFALGALWLHLPNHVESLSRK